MPNESILYVLFYLCSCGSKRGCIYIWLFFFWLRICIYKYFCLNNFFILSRLYTVRNRFHVFGILIYLCLSCVASVKLINSYSACEPKFFFFFWKHHNNIYIRTYIAYYSYTLIILIISSPKIWIFCYSHSINKKFR